MNKRGFKMNPEELQAWMAIRKKCHTHDNENKKAYTRKQKHKKEWAQARMVFARENPNYHYTTLRTFCQGEICTKFLFSKS